MVKVVQIISVMSLGILVIEVNVWAFLSGINAILIPIGASSIGFLGFILWFFSGNRDQGARRVANWVWLRFFRPWIPLLLTLVVLLIPVALLGVGISREARVKVTVVLSFQGKAIPSETVVKVVPAGLVDDLIVKGREGELVFSFLDVGKEIFLSAESSTQVTIEKAKSTVARGASVELTLMDLEQSPSKRLEIIDRYINEILQPNILSGLSVNTSDLSNIEPTFPRILSDDQRDILKNYRNEMKGWKDPPSGTTRTIAYVEAVLTIDDPGQFGYRADALNAITEKVIAELDQKMLRKEDLTRDIEKESLLVYASAMSAYNRRNWDEAIRYLEKFMSYSENTRPADYHLLAGCYANKAEVYRDKDPHQHKKLLGKAIRLLAEHQPTRKGPIPIRFTDNEPPDGPDGFHIKIKSPLNPALQKRNIHYRLEPVDDHNALYIGGTDASFAFYLFNNYDVPQDMTLTATWRWKVNRHDGSPVFRRIFDKYKSMKEDGVYHIDELEKANHPIQFLVMFNSFSNPHVLHYSWASDVPKNTYYRSAGQTVKLLGGSFDSKFEFGNVILRDRNDRLEAWLPEKVDLIEDYRKLWKAEPKVIFAIGIQGNSQYGGSNLSFEGGIVNIEIHKEVAEKK